ncbi:hypothetical protein DXG01_000746 [Tephrocybe rancida]|nr:hypothetical protein DXG01_000746 [Tephrocybe rancida]
MSNLEVTSNNFPLAAEPGAVVGLTEDAALLELVFQFVYPPYRLSLEGMAMTILSPLADAVEKYQIHTGVQFCNIYMGLSLPSNALAVLEYSLKYNYPALANRAAPFVTLKDVSLAAQQNTASFRLLTEWV